MTKQVFDAINESADDIRSLGPVSEGLDQLDGRAVKILRESGVTRMLQPKEHGGFQTHPRDFAEAVMDLARLDGSAGWIAGTLGVPPWELAMANRRLRDEVWEADPDNWIASAYAPMGTLQPAGDGYRLDGRWQAIAGIDHSEWALLGARLEDNRGNRRARRRVAHVLVPRADFQIPDDTWNVVALGGTGSKDVVVTDAFVPPYRVLCHDDVVDGTGAERAGLSDPIYHLPFCTVLPLGTTAAVIGMAEGALAHGCPEEPAVGQAAADIRASRLSVLDTVSEFFHTILDGQRIEPSARARSRRDQVQAAWRAVCAVDEIVSRSGSNAMRRDNPLQRFWRDAHMGATLLTELDAEIA